jgi:hypothetical protein
VPTSFTINTRGAGNGSLSLQIIDEEHGEHARTQVHDNGDGSVTVEYVCEQPGTYEASVRFADHHIPGR